MAFQRSVSSTSAQRIRASDAERESVGRILEAAVLDGRLTPDEAGERLATATGARYRDELGPLVADLPEPPPDPKAMRKVARAAFALRLLRLAAVAGLVLAFWGLTKVFFFWPFWLVGLALFGFARRARSHWGPAPWVYRGHLWGARRGHRLSPGHWNPTF